MISPGTSKQFWNRAARDNAAWHVATGHTSESPEFFESGRREVDTFLSFAGLRLGRADRVLEIGSGVGRMTRRLAEQVSSVIATDVSDEMLARARRNLADLNNVEYVEVSGEGDLPVPDAAIDVVFSYITMQHVPTAAAQERYFAEALRVLAPGGWALIQFRRSGVVPRLLDWVGHVFHLTRGHRTLNRAWRGARVKSSVLRSYASETLSVEVMPFGRRHVWALARKD